MALIREAMIEDPSGYLQLPEGRAPRILEIGGGYGGLAHHLKTLLPEAHYYIVDLPESLAFSAIYLSILWQHQTNTLLEPENVGSMLAREAPGFTFVPNYLFPALAASGEKFDLVINSLSMSEMNVKQVREYAAAIAEMLEPTGVFFEQNQDNRKFGHLNACEVIAESFPMPRRLTGLFVPCGLSEGAPHLWTRNEEALGIKTQNPFCALWLHCMADSSGKRAGELSGPVGNSFAPEKEIPPFKEICNSRMLTDMEWGAGGQLLRKCLATDTVITLVEEIRSNRPISGDLFAVWSEIGDLIGILLSQNESCYTRGECTSSLYAVIQELLTRKNDRAHAIWVWSVIRAVWAEKSESDPSNKTLYWHGIALGFHQRLLEAHEIREILRAFPIAATGRFFCQTHQDTISGNNIASLLKYLDETDFSKISNDFAGNERANTIFLLAAFRINNLESQLGVFSNEGRKPTNAQRRLKVAVCVSGQLRGYRKSLPSWRNLGFDRVDATYFVDVWEEIECPAINAGNAGGCFQMNLLNAYRAVAERMPELYLENTYPSLHSETDAIGEKDLREFYHTDYVRVESGRAAGFLDFNHTQRSLYKIERAWELCRDSGQEFDLVVRIRPDLYIGEDCELDWKYLNWSCESYTYCDMAYEVNAATRGLSVGDQFAVGKAHSMEIYSSTFSATKTPCGDYKKWLNSLQEPYRPYSTLAYHLLSRRVLVKKIRDKNIGTLADIDPKTPRQCLNLIQDDIKRRGPCLYDGLFIQACLQDQQVGGSISG